MMFSLAACNQAALSGDNELVGYKASAMSELEAYTENKEQDISMRGGGIGTWCFFKMPSRQLMKQKTHLK